MECGRVDAIAEFQGTKDSSLKQGVNTVEREKWMDSRNLKFLFHLKVEMAGAADELNVGGRCQ